MYKTVVHRLTCDGETTKVPLLLEGLSLTDSGVAVNDNGIKYETVLITLDLANHVGLSIGRAVVVDNTQTTLESHVDGHLVLGNGIHRRRDERGLERDPLGDRGVEADLRGREANVTGEQEEVVVGQTTVLGGVHELVDVEPIAALVLLEHVQSGSMVEDLGGGTVGDRHDGSSAGDSLVLLCSSTKECGRRVANGKRTKDKQKACSDGEVEDDEPNTNRASKQ